MTKNYQIQFLRGILCLLVIIFHYTYQYSNIYLQNNFFDNFFFKNLGTFAVSGFFILNGIYIFKNENNNQNNSLEKLLYWIKRVLSIYITYIFAITIIFIFITIGHEKLGADRATNFNDYIKNIFFINFFTNSKYVDGAHWYLLYLFIFYFWAFIFDMLKKSKKSCMWMAILILNILFNICSLINNNTLSLISKYLYILFGGMYLHFFIIGVCINNIINNTLNYPKYSWTLLLIICIIYSFFINWKNVIYIILLIPTIFLLLQKKFLFLEKIKPIIIIGNHSFSIYLLHQNIGYIIINFITDYLPYFCGLIISLVSSIFIGICFNKIIYKNIKNFLVYFFNYINKKIRCY